MSDDTFHKMWLTSGLKIEPNEHQLWVCPRCLSIFPPTKIPLGNWHWCSDQDKGYVRTELIPLPSQEDLEGMLKERFGGKTEIYHNYFLLEELESFIFDNLIEDHGKVPYTPPFKKEWENASMRELWLAFVMHELHGQRWDQDGERWVE